MPGVAVTMASALGWASPGAHGRSTVITIARTNRKTVIFAPKLIPSLALDDPELTIREVAESAMREVIGRRQIQAEGEARAALGAALDLEVGA